jgi:nucleoside-diphosphate-sugar epimerase
MKALVTGITGQDGSYLTEFLLGKGYEVYGIKGDQCWGRLAPAPVLFSAFFRRSLNHPLSP